MKSHWKLWHLEMGMYVPWNSGRLRCYLKEPMLRMESYLWNGTDMVPKVEAHWYNRDGVMRSRLSVLEVSNFRRISHVAAKEKRKLR